MKFLMYTYVQEAFESIMAGSTYGTFLSVTTWGESHGKGIGVVLDGCPAGLPLTEQDIQIYLNRRKPGQSRFTTPRKEGDLVEILSGVFEGKTTVRSLPITGPDTRTIRMMQNTVSVTTPAEAALPEGRPSDA